MSKHINMDDIVSADQYTQKLSTGKLKQTNPKINQISAKQQGQSFKETDPNKLELVGVKVKKKDQYQPAAKKTATQPKQTEQKQKEYDPEYLKYLKESSVYQIQNQDEDPDTEFQSLANRREFIKGAGGYKISQQYLENKEERKIKVRSREQSKDKDEEREKRKIMKQLGIEHSDVNEYFDILDDRVYDREKQPDDEVHQNIKTKVENKLNYVTEQNQNKYQKIIEKEEQHQKEIETKQEIWDRLFGVKKQPQVVEEEPEEEIDDDQKQQLFEDDFEQLKENNYVLQNVLKYQPHKFDEEEEKLKEENKKTKWDKHTVHAIINSGQADFETIDELKQQNREKLQEMEYLYFKKKRDSEGKNLEEKNIKDKIAKGIMHKPLTEKEKEYKSFEDDFKNYVKKRKEQDKLQKMQQVTDKKEFDYFQSTSPDPTHWKGKPKAPFRENISSLTPKVEQEKIRSLSHKKGENQLNLSQDSPQNQSHLSKNKFNEKDKTSEMKLINQIFQKLDQQKSGVIEKISLVKLLSTKPELLDIYTLDQKHLNHTVMNYKSKINDKLNLEELVDFLKQKRAKKEEKVPENYFAQQIRQERQKEEEQNQKDIFGSCLLANEQIQIMKNIFEDLDKEKDYLVLRQKLVDQIRNDARIIKILHIPAVYVQSIGKSLTIDKVLYKIEKEQLIGTKEEKKQKEYITWNQFFEYFSESSKTITRTSDEAKDIQQYQMYNQIKNTVDDQEVNDITDQAKEFLIKIFKQTPKQSQIYVKTSEFVENIRSDVSYMRIFSSIGRKKAQLFNLPTENFNQVIDRIADEADEYCEVEEIMQYFTRRGCPKQVAEEQKQQGKTMGQSPELKQREQNFIKSMRESRIKHSDKDESPEKLEDEVIEAYDSDPEIHTYNQGYYQKRTPRLPKARSLRDLHSSQDVRDLSHSQKQDEDYQQRDPKQTKSILKFADTFESQDFKKSQNTQKKKIKFDLDDKDHSFDQEKKPKTKQKKLTDSHHFSDDAAGSERGHSLGESRLGYQTYELFNERYHEKRDTSVDPKSKKGKEFPLTKPKPFQFDGRESEKSMKQSIKQSKFQEMIDENQKLEESYGKSQFKAKKIPEKVKQRDLFQKLMQEQEQKRQTVKENSIAITLAREKPFSFYKRDLEKAKKKGPQERKEFVFKANKVPWHTQVPLLDKINQEEAQKRQERCQKEQQRIMKMSKLPPRMEMWEQEKKIRELEEGMQQQYQQPDQTQRYKAKEIPDFKRLYETHKEQMDKRKSNFKPTKAVEFHFQETRKGAKRDYLDNENQMMLTQKEKPQVDKIQEARKWRTQKPTYMPPSTQKFDDYVAKQKKEREEKLKKEEDIQEQEEKRKKKLEKMKPRVQQCDKLVHDLKQREIDDRKKKQQFQDNWISTQEAQKKIINDAKKRATMEPLLLERPPFREKQLQKYSALNKMLKICEQNKVNPKELRKMFSKEELNMIEDLKFIKLHYPKYFELITEKDTIDVNKAQQKKYYDPNASKSSQDQSMISNEEKKSTDPKAFNNFIKIIMKNKSPLPLSSFTTDQQNLIKNTEPEFYNQCKKLDHNLSQDNEDEDDDEEEGYD